MASASCKEAFALFASKNSGTEATSKDITRWCTDAGVLGKKCSSNNLDIAFTKVKPRGKTTITMKELEPLMKALAPSYKDDKKLDNNEAAQAQIEEKLGSAKPAAHGTTKTSTKGNVAGMTDASKYTGAHKERFDASGKGKGLEGREDHADNSGFVGNYKGAGTYDKK